MLGHPLAGLFASEELSCGITINDSSERMKLEKIHAVDVRSNSDLQLGSKR